MRTLLLWKGCEGFGCFALCPSQYRPPPPPHWAPRAAHGELAARGRTAALPSQTALAGCGKWQVQSRRRRAGEGPPELLAPRLPPPPVCKSEPRPHPGTWARPSWAHGPRRASSSLCRLPPWSPWATRWGQGTEPPPHSRAGPARSQTSQRSDARAPWSAGRAAWAPREPSRVRSWKLRTPAPPGPELSQSPPPGRASGGRPWPAPRASSLTGWREAHPQHSAGTRGGPSPR